MGLWTLTKSIPSRFLPGFLGETPCPVPRLAQGPRSKVQSPDCDLPDFDLGLWTLDFGPKPVPSRLPRRRGQKAPLTVCGGKPDPKGTGLLRARARQTPKAPAYCVRGQTKPQRHRLTACAGGQTPKDTPYCVRGSLRQVRPHSRFGLIRRESPRPAPRRPRRAVFPAPGFDLGPRTSAHAFGGSSTSAPVFSKPRTSPTPSASIPARSLPRGRIRRISDFEPWTPDFGPRLRQASAYVFGRPRSPGLGPTPNYSASDRLAKSDFGHSASPAGAICLQLSYMLQNLGCRGSLAQCALI